MQLSKLKIKVESKIKIGSKAWVNHAAWQLPFRSFFLAGGLFSVISIAVWALMLIGSVSQPQQVMPSIIWHAHEMIFGFAALIAVGFILTAVQTWTGTPSIKGLPVVLLLVLWLTIRVLLFLNDQFSVIFAFVFTALWWFAVVVIYARIVLTVSNRRNYLFIYLLTALATLNLVTLGSTIAGLHDVALHTVRTGVLLFTMIMSVVGGRVIPFFTVRGASIQSQTPISWIEKMLLPTSVIGISIFIIGYFVELPVTPAVFMFVVGCLHLIRMTRWSGHKTLSVPLLWSLHTAYLLMGIGLILLGLSYLVPVVRFSNALHLITVGAIGLMIIAMMSRISLGHTGRRLVIKPQIIVAFMLMIIAALTRSLLPLMGFTYSAWLFSAVLWITAFSIFFITYWSVLTAPRQ